jgi:AAHS family 4-hydroxybenzoate transporter-like MFS transporter
MEDAASHKTAMVDLRAVVDDHKLNGYRIRVLLLIMLAMLVDGFDATAMSYAAPSITREWSLGGEAMGRIFAMGSFGIMVGGAIAALAGDYLGRRPTMIISTLVCAVTTFATAFSDDASSLMIWRFLSGLGIGALTPTCLVVANEFAPSRTRATILGCMFLGFSAGAQALAGWLTAFFVPVYGWKLLFYFGGTISLLTTALLVAAMPESLKHLYAKRAAPKNIARIAARLNPAMGITADSVFTWKYEQQTASKLPLRMLFGEGRWKIMPVLWLTYFCVQSVGPGLMLWLPSLLGDKGIPAGRVANVMIMFSVLGLIGGMISARLMDRFGIICHAGLILLGIPLVLALTVAHGDPVMLPALVAATGISVNGGLIGMAVMVGFLYPTAIRSTGVGLAIFISRFGIIAGPLVIGRLVEGGASLEMVFQACALPLAVAGVGAIVLGLMDRPRFNRERAAQQLAKA